MWLSVVQKLINSLLKSFIGRCGAIKSKARNKSSFSTAALNYTGHCRNSQIMRWRRKYKRKKSRSFFRNLTTVWISNLINFSNLISAKQMANSSIKSEKKPRKTLQFALRNLYRKQASERSTHIYRQQTHQAIK